MDNNTSGLDNKVKSKFKLFSGVRSQEEDQKIYDKVMDLCFDEMMLFISENLSEEGRDNLKKEIEQQKSEEDKFKSLSKYLATIENYQNKLSLRMDAFLDGVLNASINK